MKKSSTTIHDVAATVGVSTATVSKYMNGKQRFSAPVEAKLKTAIEQLGYRSSSLARPLIAGETRTVALTLRNIDNLHLSNIVKGASRIALQRDYTLLLVDIKGSQELQRPLLEALAKRVDGMITSSRMPEESVQWMLALHKPVVLLGRNQHLPLPSVGTDNYLAAYMLTRHLLNQGHRRVAYLGVGQSCWNHERIRGAQACLTEQKLSVTVYDTHVSSPQAGESACSAIMLGPSRPEAVICYNDMIALGFIKEARALGFSLPRDVSVAGFDNAPYGDYAWPALTTIDLQGERMGELAMLKLIDSLAGKNHTEHSLLEPRLIVRESTMWRPNAPHLESTLQKHAASPTERNVT